MKESKKGLYALFFKRLFDITASLLVIILFSWLFLLLAVLVRVKLGSPVLFRQERPGKIDKDTGKETIFKLFKFRTMTEERDGRGELLPDEKRITAFGSFLRRNSLDELPEFFNILKGDMSLVGPRPLLVRYLDRYNEEQRHRHDVRPGLTGYAQVHGRNALSWEDKFAMDVWYTKNVTFPGDMRILLDTVKTVLSHEGISSETSATMEEFMGTPEGVEATWREPN
ncbi:MAG: sugar transferase [Lachnospiraceae bacterium]|nr:sugar transferase [Lachnospiraceae bacterium]